MPEKEQTPVKSSQGHQLWCGQTSFLINTCTSAEFFTLLKLLNLDRERGVCGLCSPDYNLNKQALLSWIILTRGVLPLTSMKTLWTHKACRFRLWFSLEAHSSSAPASWWGSLSVARIDRTISKFHQMSILPKYFYRKSCSWLQDRPAMNANR